jgi:anti-anti-sigma factor
LIEPAYEFQDEVRRKVAGGSRKIVIDLAGVERIDSCGIGILASRMWSASQVNGGMVLAAVPRQVEKLLQIVMLLDHIDHAVSREAAIALLQGR